MQWGEAGEAGRAARQLAAEKDCRREGEGATGAIAARLGAGRTAVASCAPSRACRGSSEGALCGTKLTQQEGARRAAAGLALGGLTLQKGARGARCRASSAAGLTLQEGAQDVGNVDPAQQLRAHLPAARHLLYVGRDDLRDGQQGGKHAWGAGLPGITAQYLEYPAQICWHHGQKRAVDRCDKGLNKGDETEKGTGGGSSRAALGGMGSV